MNTFRYPVKSFVLAPPLPNPLSPTKKPRGCARHYIPLCRLYSPRVSTNRHCSWPIDYIITISSSLVFGTVSFSHTLSSVYGTVSICIIRNTFTLSLPCSQSSGRCLHTLFGRRFVGLYSFNYFSGRFWWYFSMPRDHNSSASLQLRDLTFQERKMKRS
jgi:hypothetical protein